MKFLQFVVFEDFMVQNVAAETFNPSVFQNVKKSSRPRTNKPTTKVEAWVALVQQYCG